MLPRRFIPLAAFFLFLAGCSGPMVQTKHDRSQRFSELRTYAWQTKAENPKDPALDARIRSAVDQSLAEKQFTPARAGSADILLSYQVTTEEKVDATYLENQARAEFMGLTYTLGTLTLRMTRGTPPATIWEGSVAANVEPQLPQEEKDRRLQNAVRALLAKFPPKP